jgi:hypothetical protein
MAIEARPQDVQRSRSVQLISSANTPPVGQEQALIVAEKAHA